MTVQYGEPVTFPVNADPDRDQQQQAANQIFDRVRAMYVELEENGRATCSSGCARACRRRRRARSR